MTMLGCIGGIMIACHPFGGDSDKKGTVPPGLTLTVQSSGTPDGSEIYTGPGVAVKIRESSSEGSIGEITFGAFRDGDQIGGTLTNVTFNQRRSVTGEYSLSGSSNRTALNQLTAVIGGVSLVSVGGTVRLQQMGHKIVGRLEADLAPLGSEGSSRSVSARFEGESTVACFAHVVPGVGRRVEQGGSGESWALDVDFASQFCQQFIDLK
jgi:hypothetical protein